MAQSSGGPRKRRSLRGKGPLPESSPEFDVCIFQDVMVPMRDKVRLATDIYRPARDGEPVQGKFPAILIRTSIGKGHPEWQPQVDFFPRRGYVVVIQDIRSRYRSEGNGEYYHTCNPWEGDDGYDTIEWIARQPWCDGRVGMMGSSHRAIVQTQAALRRPPHLVTICPEQGPTNIYAHEAREGGAMALHMYTALYVHALESQEIRDDPAAVRKLVEGMRHARQWLLRTPFQPQKVPLSAAPCMERTLFNYYRRGEYDDWWAQECNDQTAYFHRHADIPCLITAGWYDAFVGAATHYFETMVRQNKSTVRLIIGPWSHGGMRLNRSYVGDVDFGPDSVWGYPKHSEIRLRWLDRWLKGLPTDVEKDPPVEIFVMGGGSGRKDALGHMEHGGRWRSEQEWPIARAQRRLYYLHPEGLLSEKAPSSDAERASFVFDPENPVPTAGGSHVGFLGLTPLEDGLLPDVPSFGARIATYSPYMRTVVPIGPMHQKETAEMVGIKPPYRLFADRPDVLVFQTPPLSEDVEVTGPIEVILWVSSSAVDTDFTAKLLDVYPPNEDYPEGYHLNLVDSIIRCRYRNSWTAPEMMTPGAVYQVRVQLPPTSNLFKAGHRIRLDISSSNFPRFDVNPNTGEPMGRHTHSLKALNTVYLDRQRPSHVVLPVIPIG